MEDDLIDDSSTLIAQPGGWIDIHSHLLPGIDDGCQTLGESLECIAMLKAAGFVGTICTPHILPPSFPNNIPAIIKMRVAELRSELRKANIDYQLWDGGELRLECETIDWCIEFGVPTLGESRCVLVDTWDTLWPDYCTEALDWLKSQGYQPILAHPERMSISDPDLRDVLERLRELGVPLQGNMNSLAGAEGPRAKRWADELLLTGQYQLLALDMHRPNHLPSRLDGIAVAQAQVGSVSLKRLLADRPRSLAMGEPVVWDEQLSREVGAEP